MLMMATTTLGALCMVYSSLSRNKNKQKQQQGTGIDIYFYATTLHFL